MQNVRNAVTATARVLPKRIKPHMEAEWKDRLQQSLKKNKHLPYGKYYQVATVRPDGRPANRTIVHRGFYGENGLTWITDNRSHKVEELAQQPWCEAAWYFEDSREQFRLGGRMFIVGKEHNNAVLLKERQRLWSSLSPPSRQQFLNPDPGLTRDHDKAEAFKQEPPPADSHPVDCFCMVLHDIEEVDYLSLKGFRRWEYRSSTGEDSKREWTSREVNP